MKIYQVEVSNYCNLSCEYCPYPKQYRKKGFMDKRTFETVIQLAKKCNQNLLYLHNFGEPLLHPELVQFVEIAKKENIECRFFTNGVLLKEDLINALYEAGIRCIGISDHISNIHIDVLREIEKAKKDIIIEEIYVPVFKHDWAGQVNSPLCNHKCRKSLKKCIFERENAFVVLWNGDVACCCLDCNGMSVKTNVFNLIQDEYNFSKFELCEKCDLMRGDEKL